MFNTLSSFYLYLITNDLKSAQYFRPSMARKVVWRQRFSCSVCNEIVQMRNQLAQYLQRHQKLKKTWALPKNSNNISLNAEKKMLKNNSHPCDIESLELPYLGNDNLLGFGCDQGICWGACCDCRPYCWPDWA